MAAVASRHWTLATKGRLAQAAGIADRILPAAALVVAAGGFGLYDWVGAVTAGLGESIRCWGRSRPCWGPADVAR